MFAATEVTVLRPRRKEQPVVYIGYQGTELSALQTCSRYYATNVDWTYRV